MSTPTTTPVFTPSGSDLSFGGTLRSEWIKLRSIRSTVWCFLILVALTIGFAMLIAPFAGGTAEGAWPAQGLAVASVTASLGMTSLVVSVLGVLVISGEYGTGMIRSTLTAVPKRTPALLAKALVLAFVTFVVSAIAFLITVPIVAAVLSAKHFEVDIGDVPLWTAVLGGVGYLVLVALFSFSIGAIVRNTAGGLAIALGVLLALPIVLSIMAAVTQLPWLQSLQNLLPSVAGAKMYEYTGLSAFSQMPPQEGVLTLEPWQGGLVLAAWAVVAFVIASVLLKRRDA